MKHDVAVLSPLAGAHYLGLPVGGAELQSTHLAHALVRRGLSVAHIVDVDPAAVAPDVDAIAVIPLGPSYRAAGLTRRRAVAAALRAADARLYVQRSASFETGITGAFARARRRRFVFSASSEADFRLDAATTRIAGASLDDWKTRAQYRLGVRCAHAVVVQTRAQHALASAAFGIDTVVIPSFGELAPVTHVERDAFLWVGGMASVKDPLAFVALATAVPDARFRMLATERGRETAALAAAVREAAAACPNIELLAPRSRTETLDLYTSAIAVVNTSHLEGFPNTFLEGWARATPALSLRVDPDGVIVRRGLGFAAAGSLDRLAEATGRFWHDRAAAAEAGAAARRYLEEVHAPAVVGARWAALVERLLQGRP
jgi:glycosyltransferase involved in cell wall biosynthesis